jgi:AcrR family transcriptional regulator
VTRGALYHHFTGKEDLFRAVFEEMEQEMTDRLTKVALGAPDPLDALRVGCREFLDVAMDPAVQRIVLIDAPAVLGWQTWREVEARYGLGLVTFGLQNAMDAEMLTKQPVEPLAHMLLASLNEAALLVAGSDNPKKTRVEVGAVVDHFINRLAVT